MVGNSNSEYIIINDTRLASGSGSGGLNCDLRLLHVCEDYRTSVDFALSLRLWAKRQRGETSCYPLAAAFNTYVAVFCSCL